MGLATGQRLADADMSVMTDDGPAVIRLADKLKGRKVVVFALPGAYTGPCSTIHLPSFVRTADQFRAKGIDEIICISVNDPFVLAAWGDVTGAKAAGITLLGDADGSFTKGLGMDFTAPPIGLIGRSNRYAAVVDDGVIVALSVDDPGVCDLSTGEKFLATL